MNGIWRRSASSKATEPQSAAALAVLILLTIGAMLAYSRIGAGWHLHLPGHQGLIRITVMLLAARGFGLPWSATTIAAGAGTVDWYMPAHALDPVTPLGYFLCGLVIDLSLRAAPAWRGHAVFLAAVGAAASVSKPLTLWLIAAVSNLEFTSLSHGLAYPLMSHLAFGMGAGLFAAGLISVLTRRN